LRVSRAAGPLLPQIEAALALHGQPLRWAITAVAPPADPTAGLAGSLLTIEAVVLA
jgi:hypothetical protein